MAQITKITTDTHPLVRLRSICGFTREQAAQICAMSAANVQNVELLRTDMPLDAALRMEAATGCLASSLMGSKDEVRGKKPLAMNGELYERKMFEEFVRAGSADDEKASAAFDDLNFRLKLLLEASGTKFVYAARRIGQFLDALRLEAGIQEIAIQDAARKSAEIETLEIKVSELRKRLATTPGIAAWLDARSIRDSESCKVIVETFRAWPAHDASRAVTYAVSTIRSLWRVEFKNGQRLQVAVDKGNVRGVAAGGFNPSLVQAVHSPEPKAKRAAKRQPNGNVRSATV